MSEFFKKWSNTLTFNHLQNAMENSFLEPLPQFHPPFLSVKLIGALYYVDIAKFQMVFHNVILVIIFAMIQSMDKWMVDSTEKAQILQINDNVKKL